MKRVIDRRKSSEKPGVPIAKLAYWAEPTAIQAKLVTGCELRAGGKNEEALAAKRAAADHEARSRSTC